MGGESPQVDGAFRCERLLLVLDRTDGKCCWPRPWAIKNWTTGYGKDGRPVLTGSRRYHRRRKRDVRDRNPEMAGSVSLDPASKLFFVRLFPGCSAVRKDPTPPEMGQRFFGGSLARGQGGSRSLIRRHGMCTPAQRHGSIRCSAVASAVPARSRPPCGLCSSARATAHYGAGLQNRNPHLAFRKTGPGLAGFTHDLYGRRHTICGSCRDKAGSSVSSDAIGDRPRMARSAVADCLVRRRQPRFHSSRMAAVESVPTREHPRRGLPNTWSSVRRPAA